jgi:hypothetical protein
MAFACKIYVPHFAAGLAETEIGPGSAKNANTGRGDQRKRAYNN